MFLNRNQPSVVHIFVCKCYVLLSVVMSNISKSHSGRAFSVALLSLVPWADMLSLHWQQHVRTLAKNMELLCWWTSRVRCQAVQIRNVQRTSLHGALVRIQPCAIAGHGGEVSIAQVQFTQAGW